MVDVKVPGVNYRRLRGIGTVYLGSGISSKEQKGGIRWGAIIGVCVLLLFGVAFVFGTKKLKSIAAERGEIIAENMLASIQSIRDLDPEGAKKILEENRAELGKIGAFVEGGKKQVLLGGLGEIFPSIRAGVGLFGKLSEFNLTFLEFTNVISELQAKGLDYVMHNGQEFLSLLQESRQVIRNLADQAADIQNKSATLGSVSESFEKFNGSFRDAYVNHTPELHQREEALRGLETLMGSKTDKHILFIFHNPSEIRPAGGFIGSYGDVVVREGQIQNIEVGDIYWPDHPKNFERKIIPPLPLQKITTDWGARDGNWFFDFPASAKNVIGFLESSKIYKETGTTFDAAIAINTNVLGSVLGLVGPIEAPEYEMTITRDNFLAELQREVETGRDKEPGKNPKRVLSAITPTIMDRLGALSDEQKKTLVLVMQKHIEKKDIMLYAKDPTLASFLKSKGVDGSVYELPNGFWGAYLAVVNANIGGEKTDAFMEQKIAAKIDVSNDGSSFVSMGIVRAHHGKDEKDRWYHAENKNYTQVYANPDASFVEVEGNTKGVKYEGRYDKKTYEEIPELKVIEDTSVQVTNKNLWLMDAFGKKVFAAWFNTPAGEVRTLNLRYQIAGESNKDLRKDKAYTLILERQSGVLSPISIDVRAPLGYVWQESGEPVYRFERENPEAREVVELHLVKN